MDIRNATPEDAQELALLINLAGEGMPAYLWQDMTEDSETPLEAGARRAARTEGGFSYTHARVCSDDGRVLGMLLSYRLPDPYEVGDITQYPELIRPLVTLEARVPGSWYINAIATHENCRGQGVARRLMADASRQSRENNCTLMSLIVASENHAAIQLYASTGFSSIHTLPVVSYPGCLHGGEWVLMTKTVDAAEG
ncbi:GNAT family N-acetyltransferase [Marinobacterium rhizophilum]|uniref:GNAT family N-acetyltransferase n=1 Tax=Marinobacterium rhizophilum TaxID=420402 RepID=UPI0003724065|nr:GNAT family N-acetyltransferase [Marinobacterium rhizophilum]